MTDKDRKEVRHDTGHQSWGKRPEETETRHKGGFEWTENGTRDSDREEKGPRVERLSNPMSIKSRFWTTK